MAFGKNINWGAVIAGAVIVTSILALAPASAIGATAAGAAVASGTFPSIINAMAAGMGVSNLFVGSGVALGGAVLGQKTANLFHRGQDAATTLVGR